MFTGNFLAPDLTDSGIVPVVTNGNTAAISGKLSGRSSGGAGGNASSPAPGTPTSPARPGSLLDARIAGTVVIGGTNRMEINAVPGAP